MESIQIIPLISIIVAIAVLLLAAHKLRSWRRRRKLEVRERILRGDFLSKTKPNQTRRAVFISYRRSDSLDVTERIHDRLQEVFGKNAIFRDSSGIELASDFREVIFDTLKVCKVFLLIMGRDWQGKLPGNGSSRISDKDDIMRLEIETALRRKVPIVNILVQGAAAPSDNSLPETIREVAFRQAIRVRPDPDFDNDMDRIIEFIKEKAVQA